MRHAATVSWLIDMRPAQLGLSRYGSLAFVVRRSGRDDEKNMLTPIQVMLNLLVQLH